MNERALKIFRLPFLVRPSALARSGRRRSAWRSARAGLFFGFVAFAVLTAGLMTILGDVRPGWQDPQFGSRLKQLQEWKKKAPDRPLVLAMGSSRMQFGLSPSVMGFPDEPGEPLVYNFGYQGGLPHIVALNLARILDAGVRPQCVLVEYSPPSYVTLQMERGTTFAHYLHTWPNRFSLRDVARMRELDGPLSTDWGEAIHWLSGYATPWSAQRLTLLSHHLPDWLPQSKTDPVNVHGQPRDEYGFTPLEEVVTDENRRLYLIRERKSRSLVAEHLANIGQVPPIGPIIGSFMNRCRAEGIPVVFVWIPESPTLQGWFPEVQAIGEIYATHLTRDYSVALFPPPTHLVDEEFVDGLHMLPGGAERYSRWLADTHLKPWLVAQGLKRP